MAAALSNLMRPLFLGRLKWIRCLMGILALVAGIRDSLQPRRIPSEHLPRINQRTICTMEAISPAINRFIENNETNFAIRPLSYGVSGRCPREKSLRKRRRLLAPNKFPSRHPYLAGQTSIFFRGLRVESTGRTSLHHHCWRSCLLAQNAKRWVWDVWFYFST